MKLNFLYCFSNNLETLGIAISGHGLLDLTGYGQFLAGKLADYKPQKIEAMIFSH